MLSVGAAMDEEKFVMIDLKTSQWMIVGRQRIRRNGDRHKFEWKATDINPYAGSNDPFEPLRAAEARGDLIMATRKRGPFNFELLVKAPR
jgi:hypothetical protein